jgi:hypothetical protein
MNKKLVVVAALMFVAVSYMFAQGVAKAQDANATDNSTMNSENGTMNNGT